MNSEFQKFFEKAAGLCIILRPDLTIAAVSDAYAAQAYTTREKLIERKFFDIFPDIKDQLSDEDAGELRKSLENVVATKTAERMPPRKYQIPRPKSLGGGFEIRYWGSTNTPILSDDGRIEYVLRQVEDITSRVYTEQERDAFFAHSFDMLAVVGTDGYFKRVNPAFERTMGYTEEELYAQPIESFLHPDDVEKTRKNISILSSGNSKSASVNRYRCKDGTYKWFSWNTSPVGSFLYTVGRDITEQVAYEETIKALNLELAIKNEELERKVQDRLNDLRKSEEQVQQLQKMDAVGRLAGGIAHDFNNMLGAISLYCDVLQERAEKPEAVIKNVKNISNVTNRAAALTKQLLLFSRNQAIQLKTISLNPLVNNMESMLTRLIHSNIKIQMKLADDLALVNVDPSQMEQVVLNLVVNARDAMPNGGAIRIETSNVYLDETFASAHLAISPGKYILLSVSDEGTGMPPEVAAKIFEPFYTTKEVGKGTGLGLTTTYGIVKQSKGSIYVYSELNKGTVFKIYLPVANEAADKPTVTVTTTPTYTGSETILLTEDDQTLREGFSEVLERQGYKVLVAANGMEATQICEAHAEKIDMLLTDMVMPGMTGYELAKRAVTVKPDIKILFMSGYTNDSLENNGGESLRTIDFIQKPFSANDLAAKVHGVLKRPS